MGDSDQSIENSERKSDMHHKNPEDGRDGLNDDREMQEDVPDRPDNPNAPNGPDARHDPDGPDVLDGPNGHVCGDDETEDVDVWTTPTDSDSNDTQQNRTSHEQIPEASNEPYDGQYSRTVETTALCYNLNKSRRSQRQSQCNRAANRNNTVDENAISKIESLEKKLKDKSDILQSLIDKLQSTPVKMPQSRELMHCPPAAQSFTFPRAAAGRSPEMMSFTRRAKRTPLENNTEGVRSAVRRLFCKPFFQQPPVTQTIQVQLSSHFLPASHTAPSSHAPPTSHAQSTSHAAPTLHVLPARQPPHEFPNTAHCRPEG